MSDAQMFTVFDIALAVFRSPLKFLFWFLFFFAFVVLTYVLVPRQYGSDGKLFVQVGRSSVGAAPTTSAGKVSLQDSRQTEVKSVVGLLESRELADRVVEIVGVEKVLKPHSSIGRWLASLPQLNWGGGVSSEDTPFSNEDIKVINRRNKAIEELMQSLEIEHQKNTTVVSVGCKAQSPFLAQQITQAYLDEYQKKHVEVNTPQSGGFFTAQLKLRQQELAKSEKQLADFRSGIDVLDIGGARSLLQREIDQLKLDSLSTKVKLSEAREKYLNIKKDFLKIPEFIVGADKKTSSLARDKAREALYSLQLEESELSAKYRSGNPKLVAIREAISNAKKQLNQIPQTFKEAQRSINPARKEIRVMMTQASAEANGSLERLAAIKELVKAKLGEVKNLNTLAIKESQLVHNVDICRKTMLGIADKTAESVTLDALDSERISNVKVAQAASLIPKKVFPSGLSFAALGATLSAFLATIMTFLKAFRLGYQIDRRNRQRAGAETREPSQKHDHQDDQLNQLEDASHGSRLKEEPARHHELREKKESARGLSEAERATRKRSETWKRRAENQVSAWMLLGGFTVLISAYFLMAALR